MKISGGFLLRILKSDPFSKKETGQMTIVTSRPYDHLAKDIQSVFKDREDVNIKVDRRYGQRRIKKETFSDERRQADRRKTKELLVEVVISM